MFKITTVKGSLNALNGTDPFSKDPFSKKWLYILLLILIALLLGVYFFVKYYKNTLKKDEIIPIE